MGALTIQPLSVLQQAVSENPAPQGAPAAPSTDANLAQSGGAPQDTVVLTGKGADAQLAGGDSNGSQPQQTALFLAAQNIFLGQDNTEETGNPQQVQAPPVPAQAQTPGTPEQTAATAANTAGNSAASTSSTTPQQQLANLDQTLQELGINPQSISLFNRMTLLLYASDPAALRVLVQGLQGAAQQQGQSGGANSAASTGEPASAQGGTQASNPSAANGTGNSSAQPPQQSTQSQAQTVPQQSGSAADGSSQGSSTTQSTGAANQYQGLQFTFANIAIQDLQSDQATGSTNPAAQGQGINITV